MDTKNSQLLFRNNYHKVFLQLSLMASLAFGIFSLFGQSNSKDQSFYSFTRNLREISYLSYLTKKDIECYLNSCSEKLLIEVKEKYGLEIIFAENDQDITGIIENAELLRIVKFTPMWNIFKARAAILVNNEIKKYPPGLFKKVGVKTIAFSGQIIDIQSNPPQQVAGANDHRATVIISTQGLKGETFFVLHHEIAGIISHTTEFKSIENNWRSYLPDPNYYHGINMNQIASQDIAIENNEKNLKEFWDLGFAVPYGQISLEDDFSTIAEWLFDNPNSRPNLESGLYPQILGKIRLAKAVYRRYGMIFSE